MGGNKNQNTGKNKRKAPQTDLQGDDPATGHNADRSPETRSRSPGPLPSKVNKQSEAIKERTLRPRKATKEPVIPLNSEETAGDTPVKGSHDNQNNSGGQTKLQKLRDSVKERYSKPSRTQSAAFDDALAHCSSDDINNEVPIDDPLVHSELQNTPLHKERRSDKRTPNKTKHVSLIGPNRNRVVRAESSNINAKTCKLGPSRKEMREIEHDGVVCTVNSSDDDLSDISETDERADDDLPGSSYSSEGEESSESSGSSAHSMEDEEDDEQIRHKLQNDPNYRRIMDSLLAEKLKRSSKQKKHGPKRLSHGKRDFVILDRERQNSISRRRRSPLIKSPSDSTLYTPALKLRQRETDTQNVQTIGQTNIIDQVSSFVDKMRLQSSRRDGETSRSSRRNSVPEGSDSRDYHDRDRDSDAEQSSSRKDDHEARAKELTDKLILESEKFKADLIAPKGMAELVQTVPRVDREVELMRRFDNDDDFFYISCHIEPQLRQKIEKGEFVDLEKLLPKERSAGGGFSMNEDNRIRLCQEEGETFLAPVRTTPKIGSIRKWDSAFRIYTTIFSQANPERASELLQYAHIINTAASNYPWENVAYYDFTFRHLMASKPWRSWAKTYTQGWNLALNSVPSFRSSGGNASTSSYNNNNNQKTRSFQKQSQSSGGDWRDKCCWKYGKNKCNRSSKDCKWDHRCKFCGGWNHSYNDCKKRNPKQTESTTSQSPSTSTSTNK